jgi:hypothetical protein
MVSILQHTGKLSWRSAYFPKLLVLLADANIASGKTALNRPGRDKTRCLRRVKRYPSLPAGPDAKSAMARKLT